ncbi:MAG: 4-hydroxy-tetrahydrodipicolinate reductase [Chlamydiae bacterium]|nr:4-hydroxy-tetrahydrodipicolinate reductase [Chlamydiota bacterium]
MKCALMGYGKMGKAVEKIALERGHQIVDIGDAEVCIDFSHPDVVLDHVKKAVASGASLVIGTTGWEEDYDAVREIVDQAQIGCVFSPNFSVGVHLFLQMISYASQLMNQFEEYDVGGFEMHHKEKVDSPSGTAKWIVERLLSHIDRKESAVFDLDQKRGENELHFSSVRCGDIAGTHSVIFNSFADSITLTHEAKNRSGFALGAVIAAERILGRKGWIGFDELCFQDLTAKISEEERSQKTLLYQD